MSQPHIRLYMFPGSNAVATAELMLRHKGLDYERRELLPVLHAPYLRLVRRFRGITVPAMTVDGDRVQGTRRIARYLDGVVEEPRLFPAGAPARERVEELERLGGQLQDATRRIFYCLARRDPDAVTSVLGGPGSSRLLRVYMRLFRGAVIAAATRGHGATDERARADLCALPGMLDTIDQAIVAGDLDADAPTAADFQVAVNVRALMIAPSFAAAVAGRPLADHALQLMPVYPGHVEERVPAEWLAPLHELAAARTH